MTSAGRAFQTRAPATEKARRPTVGSLTAGTHRSSEVEDRSLCRVGMSATEAPLKNCSGEELHKKIKVYNINVNINL